MPPASSRLASVWLRSRLRLKIPRQARERGLFDDHGDEDEEDDEGSFDLFKPQPSSSEPSGPKKPAPKPKTAPPKSEAAPPKPKSEMHWHEQGLRNDPLFPKFLEEKYQGGEARVPNPNHETRERFPDVSFSTAMKDAGFRKQVHNEFELWKGEQAVTEKRHKRLEVGETVEHISQLREDDVLEDSNAAVGGGRYRVVSIHDGYIRTREVDENGKDSRSTTSIPKLSLTSGRFKRIEDPAAEEREKAKKREEAQAKEREERQERARERAREREKNPPDSSAWAAAQEKLLDLARTGEVIHARPIGDGNNANVTSLRTLRGSDGTEHRFVWKPKTGEAKGLRHGISAGSYHQREAAAFGFDRLLGEGTVVPPTVSNGEGSYQAFEAGAQTFLDVDADFPDISVGDLSEHPDFHRINLLDAILGNEDRHRGNIMLVADDSQPSGHRFIAIDNGLTLATPTKKKHAGHYVAREPWSAALASRVSYEKRDAVKERVGKAVAQSTQDIDPELHARLKKVTPDAFAKALTSAGVRTPAAIAAALVRFSAIQRDPKIIGKIAKWMGAEGENAHLQAIQAFFYLSGKTPDKLLQLAGGDGPSPEELFKVVKRALR
jgi:hypothetical protein